MYKNKTITTNYTLEPNVKTVLVNAGSSNITITIPDPSKCGERVFDIMRFSDTDTGNITITTTTGNLQNPVNKTLSSSITIDNAYQGLGYTSNTVSWHLTKINYSSAGNTSVSGTIAVTTNSNMKALTGLTNNQYVKRLGYYSINDGGDADYIWDSSSTDTDDGGSIIALTAGGTGRFKLVYNGNLNAKAFGIKGDGVNDDGVQLQKAINFIVNKGGKLFLPNGIINTSVKLTCGTLSPSSNPYTEVSWSIVGVGPTLNPGASSVIYTNGTSINYTGGASSTNAVIEMRVGASRFVRLQDFSVTSTTLNAAGAAILFSQTGFSQFFLERVHMHHSTSAFSIENSSNTWSNGEFFTFIKCVFEGESNAFKMGNFTGQSFDHSFYDCGMSVKDGGTLVKIGSSGLGYSLNFYGLKSSNNWVQGTGLGVTLLDTAGSTGNINFWGGRIEAISTVLKVSALGTLNANSKIFFNGLQFDGMGSDNSHPFITSNVSGTSAAYNVRFSSCKFNNTYASAGSLKIDLGTSDASRYFFHDCDFEGFRSKSIITNSDERTMVQFISCRETDPVTGLKFDFSKHLSYNDTDALTSRHLQWEHAEQSYGKAENLLLYSNFGVNTGAALSPWVHTGQTTFYEVRKIGYGGVNFSSPHSIQMILRASSGVYQNISAAPFSSSINTYYFQAVVSTEYMTGGSITFSLENSNTNRIYESVTITNGTKNTIPVLITLRATDGNVGGNLRLRINNNRTDLGICNINYMFVSKSSDGCFVPTTNTAIQNPTIWSMSSDMVRVFGRLKIPLKNDETGSGSTTITDLDNDASADIYISNSNNRLTWRSGAKWRQTPNSQYGSAAPTTGTWVVGDIFYNSSPTASGYIGWVCVSAGTPGTWKGFGAIQA